MMTEETEETLNELGFRRQWEGMDFPHGEYYTEDLTKKVSLRGDGIYAHTVGTVPNEDYLEMHLNFIPEDAEMLKALLKRVFYLQ